MSDPFADWYTTSVTPVIPAGYDDAGEPIAEQVGTPQAGQLRRSNQLARSSDGTEVVSSATFAVGIAAAAAFRSAKLVELPDGERLEVISVSINDADPVLAGATVYLGAGRP